MSSYRTLTVSLCVLMLAGPAWAQDAAVAVAAEAAAEPVLSHIPAGSLGFVVIPSAKRMAGKVDKLLADLGLAQMLPSTDPDDPAKKASVLDLLRGAAQLGPGFNPGGGVAVVMLDPNAYGIDLLQLMQGGLGGPRATKAALQMAGPGEAGDKPTPKLPFVLYVPGKSVKDVFGAYPMEAAGKYMLVNLRMGPVYAIKRGSYILLSPNDKALEAVLTAKTKAAADLPKEQLAALAKGDIGYYLNMKVAEPVVNQFLGLAEQQIVSEAGPIAPVMGVYFGMYRNIIGQLDAITVAGRIMPTGLVFDEMVSFRPGTEYAKAMATTPAPGKLSLDALPDLPYGLAMGSSANSSPESVKLGLEMVDGLLKSEPFKGLAEEDKTRLRKIVREMNEQITGVQIAIGGAPANSGVFGASFVIRCKKASVIKDLLVDKAKLAQGLIKHFGADEPDVQKLSIRYLKNIETVGSVSVDCITVQHPKLDEMNEDERVDMKKVLGEDKIRFFIAAIDDKTVLVTFGGSRNFLTEAIKAARGEGKIGTTPDDAKAMKHMPKKPTAIILLNGANIFNIILAGVKTMDPDEEMPPFKISCKTPIAIGVGQAGASAHIVAYVPTDLIKEIVGTVMMFSSGMGPGGPPPVGGDDF